MDIYQRGETAKLTALTVDEDGAAADPATSTKITIDDPNGTVISGHSDQAMTNITTGSWKYYYLIGAAADLGQYTYQVTATNGSYITIEHGHFTVVDAHA